MQQMRSDFISSEIKKIINLTQLIIKTNVNVNVNEETKGFFKAAIDLPVRYSLRS